MTTCIDLHEQFGDQFRVAYDESYRTERGNNGRLHDPWLMLLPCQHGHIYPHGGALLGASTDHRGPIANRLAALPFAIIVQDGDDGLNVVFDVEAFDEVAAIMKPKRRRRLSTDKRTEQVARLRDYWFPSATQHARSNRRRDATGTIDSQAV